MTTALQQSAVDRLIRDTLTIGGATIPLNGGAPPTVGFMVGGVAPPIVLSGEAASDPVLLRAMVNARLDGPWSVAADLPTMYLGSWTDTDGTVYVEISERVETLQQAERLGRERREIAVWDLAAGREVRLATTAA